MRNWSTGCGKRRRPVGRGKTIRPAPVVTRAHVVSTAVPAGAGGWGVEAGPAPASLPGAAVLPGGGGIILSAPGGGGTAREPPPRRGGRGAGEPGGRSVSVRPSSLPGRATMQASLATLRSWGAWSPYCSGSLSRATPGRGPCVVLVRWCRFARLSRPPREQAVGGAGARGLRVQLCPPPGVAVPSGGGGTSPRPRGGWRAGAPVARRPGGEVGGRGEGGPRRCSPPPWRGGAALAPVAPFFPGAPPLGIHVQPGFRAAAGAGRGLVGRRWVSVAGGGERSLRRGLLPRLPQAATQASCFVCAFLDAAVLLRTTAPAQSRPVDWGCLARSCARRGCGVPSLGATAPSGGCGAAVSAAGPGRPRAWGGGRGELPPSPPLVPWRRPPTAAGGRPGGSGPGGPAADWGGASFPHPPPPFGCQTLVQALAWAPCSPCCRCACACAGGGGGRRVLGAAVRVSGQRLAGCGAVGLPWRSLPPSSLPLEVARAPPPRRTVGGVWVGGPGSAGGASRGTVPSPSPRAHRLGRQGAAVTCAVVCVGAGAAAVAGSAGGSASG